MVRRFWNYEKVKEYIESFGYKLLSTEYVNYESKLEVQCDKGHDYPVTFHNFKSGYRCPKCNIINHTNRSRKKYDDVYNKFKELGLTLLTTEYKDAHTPMPCICEQHDFEIQNIRYSSVRDGHGCTHCGYETIGKKKRLSYNFVKSEFEKRNYTLLEKTYKNSWTKLKYKCKYHPDKIQKITYGDISQNHGCKYCAIEKSTGENNPMWKGGISRLQEYFRYRIIDWKKDSIRKSNYKCVISGESFDDIHHLYSFNLILEEMFAETNLPIFETINKYTKEELNILEQKCVELHYKYPLGVCLTNELHKEFHSDYGKGSNTPEQFWEFYNNKKEQMKLKG